MKLVQRCAFLFLFIFIYLAAVKTAPGFGEDIKKETIKPAILVGTFGFYYDKERQKYFSNEKSVFTVRATDQSKFLERIEVSIDGGEFKDYAGALNFTSGGVHLIRFRAVDPVLNWSPIQSFRIFVDTASPQSQVVWRGPTFSGGSDLFVNPNSSLTVVSQDNLSGVAKVIWENEGKAATFEKPINFLKEGKRSLKIFSVDNVGNKENSYTVNFTIDATAPTTNEKIEGVSFKNKKGLYISSASQIKLESQDALSGVERVEYRINDGPVTTYSGPIVVSDNKTILKYRAVDNVGNQEHWKAIDLFQDTKPPLVSLAKDGRSVTIGGKIYARSGFKLKANVLDADSGVKDLLVAMDGKNFSPTTQVEFVFNEPKEYQFYFKAFDNVGNFEEANPYTLVIDNTPPTTKLKASQKMVKKGDVYLSAVPNRLEFEGGDLGAGLDRVEISYDGKSYKELKSPIELSEWNESRRTIYYRGVDRLGNTEKEQKVDIYVRTSGPKVDLFVESENLPNLPLSAFKNSKKRVPTSE